MGAVVQRQSARDLGEKEMISDVLIELNKLNLDEKTKQKVKELLWAMYSQGKKHD